jgi:hypothetical protein
MEDINFLKDYPRNSSKDLEGKTRTERQKNLTDLFTNISKQMNLDLEQVEIAILEIVLPI